MSVRSPRLISYTTEVPANKTAGQIMALLVTKGAEAIMMQYDAGAVVSLSWRISTPHGVLPFALPINVEATQKLLQRQGVRKGDDLEHCRNVAWRIMFRWTEAQMALLETGMVDMAQVFLPYLQTAPGESLYKRLMDNEGLKMLTSGDAR